jgi:hypothetical protein
MTQSSGSPAEEPRGVLVKYHDPKHGGLVLSVGLELREGVGHSALVWLASDDHDIYSYTVIPKGLIKSVRVLRVNDND